MCIDIYIYIYIYVCVQRLDVHDHLFASSPLIHRPGTLHQIISPTGAELGAHVGQPGRKGPKTTNTSGGCSGASWRMLWLG